MNPLQTNKSRHTSGALGPRSGIVLSNGFPPISPSLGLLLAELRHRFRSAVLGRVELSEVFSPFSPSLRGSVWETSLSGSWEPLNTVRRAVFLGVENSEAPSPICPGLVGLGHSSRLRVAVLLGVEVSEALSPFSPSYEKEKKTVIRYTSARRSKITGKEPHFDLGRVVEWERE